MPAIAQPSSPDPTGTRERILRATLRVIGEQGVGAISNRRLATEAGVALGSLTYHFPSQTELLRESLLLYVQEEVERLNAIAAVIRGASPTDEEVARAVEQIVSDTILGTEQIAEFELHLQAARDPELQDASRRCFAAYDDLAMAVLQSLGIADVERNARTLVAYISGLAIRRLATGDHGAEGTAEALLVFVRGMRASA